MNQNGQKIREATVPNDPKELEKFFRGIPGPRSAVFESSRDWTVLYDDLVNLVDEVHLANPYKVRIIAEAKIKTDKIDSEILAHLLRCNMIPEAHIPSKEVLHVRYLLRQRLFFVRVRTMTKNRIHHLLDRNHLGQTVSDSFADLFGRRGLEFMEKVELPDSERKLLDEQLRLFKELAQLVDEDGRRLRKLFDTDSRVKLVATIPGLGYLFAPLVVYEIDNIDRFSSPKKLNSYARLVPSTYASGEKCYHGRLVKQGNQYLSWAMVEAVWPAIRNDPSLRQYFMRIRAKQGPNAAKIATARRLLTIVYRVLKEHRPYRPGNIERTIAKPRAALCAP